MTDADPQDPLPEPGFTYRRWLTFGATGAILGLFWALAWKIPPDHLLAFAQGLMLLLALAWLLYMGGASASDVSRIVASASLFKKIGFGGGAAPAEAPAPSPAASPKALVAERPDDPADQPKNWTEK